MSKIAGCMMCGAIVLTGIAICQDCEAREQQ